jgi:hypothetical protein
MCHKGAPTCSDFPEIDTDAAVPPRRLLRGRIGAAARIAAPSQALGAPARSGLGCAALTGCTSFQRWGALGTDRAGVRDGCKPQPDMIAGWGRQAVLALLRYSCTQALARGRGCRRPGWALGAVTGSGLGVGWSALHVHCTSPQGVRRWG